MNPLRVAGWAVSLLCDWLAPVQKPWPDGEQPLINESLLMAQNFGLVTDAVTGDPLPGGFRWGCTDHESSVPSGSTASEAGAEPKAEGPTPSAAHTLGVGHLQKLLRASAHNLHAYSDHVACPAAVYVNSLADQLHVVANSMDSSE